MLAGETMATVPVMFIFLLGLGGGAAFMWAGIRDRVGKWRYSDLSDPGDRSGWVHDGDLYVRWYPDDTDPADGMSDATYKISYSLGAAAMYEIDNACRFVITALTEEGATDIMIDGRRVAPGSDEQGEYNVEFKLKRQIDADSDDLPALVTAAFETAGIRAVAQLTEFSVTVTKAFSVTM